MPRSRSLIAREPMDTKGTEDTKGRRGSNGRTMAALLCVLCCLGVLGAAAGAVAPAPIDAAFQKFWAAHNPQEAAKAAQDVVASGVTFRRRRSRA